ncbi:MAG: hypothetical protein P8H62_04860 [Henriciella sp.]|nr:hypothetical protein [Henriciella sp.]
MSFRKILLAGAALAASTAAMAPANASIIDRPHFKVLGVVIVWAANDADGSVPIATDFVIHDDATGTAADTDLIAATGRTLVTGELTATSDGVTTNALGAVLTLNDGATDFETIDTDAPSGFAAFDVTGVTLESDDLTYESSFFVASNTVFNIEAVASETTASGDFDLTDISYSMTVDTDGTVADSGIAYGSAAQDPQGTFPAVTDLDALTTATNVYEGGRRKAASAGNIVAQSVRFDATYTLGSGLAYDLSQGAGEVEAEVTYTVYVP